MIPHVIQSGTSSWRTENGVVVDFVYRDWLAVGAGGAAAIAGVVTLLFVARADTPRRAAGALLGLALLVAGTYSVLRGFGVVGVERPAVGTRASSAAGPATARASRSHAAPDTVQARARSERIFGKWRADLLDELAAEFGWQDRRRELQRHFDTHHALLGAFTSVERADVVASDQDRTRVESEAAFEPGSIGSTPIAYCMEYAINGRKRRDGWATFELEFRVGRWEVVAFAVSSEDA
ncbi:MAG: hypothetical protein K8M05_21755 [Deltaproteobacteria bacterium]|nr:hypothetical protein [Kofleriaceae bacterium]